MNLLEKMVVTEEFCKREDIYNINVGGDGGWKYVNLSSDYAVGSQKRKNACLIAANAQIEQLKEKFGYQIDPFNAWLLSMSEQERTLFLMKFSNDISIGLKEFHAKNPGFMEGENNPRFGKKNSDNARKLISAAMLTDANFMRGAHHYINYDLHENIILHDDDTVPEGFVRGYCLNFDKYEQRLVDKKLKEQKKKEKDLAKVQKQNEIKAKQKLKEEQVRQKKLLLSEMQQWYIKFGWESTVLKFNYPYTIQAFSSQYIKYFGVSLTGRKLYKRKRK